MIIGRVLNDRYEIVEFVGQGGMARVYLGFDRTLGRDVAVKILKEEFIDNEQFLKKFKREAQADAKLSHPNIVSVYDTGNDHNIHYIIMEFIDGGTLKDYIDAKGRLSYREGINYAMAVASALRTAHRNNIVHRDVKPHNILLTKAKRIPKVADFGIARAITSSTLTMVDETMGSVHYISPEQARGGFVDARSDLYSLGIMLYEMVTGQLPYDSESPVAVALMHIQEEMSPLNEVDRGAPHGLVTIIRNLTEKSPGDRYQDAGEVIDDLRKVREDFDVYIPRTAEGYDDEPTESIPVISNLSEPEPVNAAEDDNNVVSDKKGKNGKKKKKLDKKAKIAIAAAVVLVGLFVTLWFMGVFAKEVEVPKITKMSLQDAEGTLAEVGLKYEIVERKNSAKVAKDHVISQNPKAGERMKNHKKVQIVVSLGAGEVDVPDVKGKYEEEAVSMLEGADLVPVVKKKYSNSVEKGVIISQEPGAGVTVSQGSEVTIYVSKGKNQVTLEDYKGQTEEAARSALESAGLNVSVSYEASSNYSKGQVISQSPGSYEKVTKGSTVKLVVSKGRIKSKTVSIRIPDYTDVRGSNVNVKITFTDSDDRTETVYSGTVRDTSTISVTFRGVGVGYYKVYINGEERGPTGVVTF